MQTEVLQINLHMAVWTILCHLQKGDGHSIEIVHPDMDLTKGFTGSFQCIHYLFATGLSFKIKTDGAFEKY
jgi:hypothetical protein